MHCRPDEKQHPIPVRAVGGASVRVEGLTWRPLRRRTPVLKSLDLSLSAGERVLLAGPSGAGKSTLLRALAGVLGTESAGDLSGHVTVDGGSSPRVGFLQQEPLAGVVAETAGRDVAFGLENLAVPREQIHTRVADALSDVTFPHGPEHPVAALSGGELQRLMLAGALVLGAPVLLLDEPTSMLDPVAAGAVRELLQAVITARRCTAVVVDHDLQPWLGFVNRLVVLGRGGELLADGPPQQVMSDQRDLLVDSGVWLPGSGTPALTRFDPELVEPYFTGSLDLVRADSVGVELRRRAGVSVAASRLALDGVSTTLRAGQVLAITGPSGAGKSTLTTVLAGLQRPTRGTVRSDPLLRTRQGDEPWRWRSAELATRLSWSPQFPEHGIVTATVLDEVLATARACVRPAEPSYVRATGLLEVMSLSGLTEVSPYHLSGGEQRRLMVAAALAHGPAGVLFDEPTVGQDRRTWATVLGAVKAAATAGSGVAVSTHDETAVAALGATVLRLQEGRVRG